MGRGEKEEDREKREERKEWRERRGERGEEGRGRKWIEVGRRKREEKKVIEKEWKR